MSPPPPPKPATAFPHNGSTLHLQLQVAAHPWVHAVVHLSICTDTFTEGFGLRLYRPVTSTRQIIPDAQASSAADQFFSYQIRQVQMVGHQVRSRCTGLRDKTPFYASVLEGSCSSRQYTSATVQAIATSDSSSP